MRWLIPFSLQIHEVKILPHKQHQVQDVLEEEAGATQNFKISGCSSSSLRK